jgi:hypothetical protein
VNSAVQVLGPFAHVHTVAGVLYGDQSCLNIPVPGGGKAGGPDDCQELTLLSGG